MPVQFMEGICIYLPFVKGTSTYLTQHPWCKQSIIMRHQQQALPEAFAAICIHSRFGMPLTYRY